MKKSNREPFLHITRRKEIYLQYRWGIRIVSIIIALLVCALITTAATGLNPIDVYGTMLNGAFGSTRKIWILLKEAAILLIVSLALAPAFRMKFWNLGGEGQILVGALATSACMIYLEGRVPSKLLILICLITAVAAGAIWAMIPAYFKAKSNTNETLFTLMMNYVAIQLVAFFIIVWEVPKGSGKVGIINQNSHAGWLPVMANARTMTGTGQLPKFIAAPYMVEMSMCQIDRLDIKAPLSKRSAGCP